MSQWEERVTTQSMTGHAAGEDGEYAPSPPPGDVVGDEHRDRLIAGGKVRGRRIGLEAGGDYGGHEEEGERERGRDEQKKHPTEVGRSSYEG